MVQANRGSQKKNKQASKEKVGQRLRDRLDFIQIGDIMQQLTLRRGAAGEWFIDEPNGYTIAAVMGIGNKAEYYAHLFANAQLIFDALKVYQDNNRLKHDGDAELFEKAKAVIEKVEDQANTK